jgi:DNA-binding IclR family transcriptional regulator
VQQETNVAKPSSALEKALLVIERLADEARPVSLAFLAEATDMPKQTVHRVLQQLEESRIVQRSVRRDQFILGPRMRQLSIGTLKAAVASLPIHAELERLVSDVAESANLGILNGRSVLYLDRVEFKWPLRFTISPNDQLPAHVVAIGKLLLAHLPDPTRSEFLSGARLERFTDWSITDPAALEEEFARIREDGFSTNNQEFLVGLVGTAVPVRDRAGAIIAALAIQGVIPRTSLERLAAHRPRMLETAARLTDLL